jgi:uncharacterized protein (TIGR00297 family)
MAADDLTGRDGTPGARRALPSAEVARKLVHVAAGGLAFLVRFLGPLGSAAMAVAAVVFNVLVLPRVGGRRMWRERETARGASPGMVFYPVVVLLLIVVFHRRLEVAAAVWGILAFGDGMATLVGLAVGGPRLPWNPQKSWAGSAAYAVFGAAAAAVLLLWTAPGDYAPGFALAVGIAAAVFAAAVESLPLGLDDNLSVPPLAGLVLFCLLLTEGRWGVWATPAGAEALLVAFGVNGAFAAAAWAIRGLDFSGVVAGVVVGTAVWASLGWQGWLLLAAFFVVGTGLTRLGFHQKAAAELAQERGGRRSARHVLANGGVAAAAALFAATTAWPEVFAVAMAGALGTAAADTAGSEVGQLSGRRTFLVTTLRPVPRGTQGAVSLEGTLAGIGAAATVAVVGLATGLYGWQGALAVVAAAFLGSLLESVLGATLERQGLLDNEAVNFLNTLCGALLAVGLLAFA